MERTIKARLLLVAAVAAAACADEQAAGRPGAISDFGEYEGYSEPIYSEWIRSSQYVHWKRWIRRACRTM